MSPHLTRRQVIKSFVLGAAFSNVIGRGWASAVLHELKPLSHLQNGLLRLNLVDFPALAQPLGSVRVGTSALDAAGRRQLGLFAPVIINRDANNQLHVLSAACTHEDCTVRRVDPNSQRMVCPCHGSQFGVDGRLLQGPAFRSLDRFEFRQRGQFLEIDLPDVFFEIEARRVPSSARVSLSFLAFEDITYEIHLTPAIGGTPVRVPFALTASGPLDRLEYPGQSDLPTLYVERPGAAGILQIVMRTREV
jgi:nitrite reductase/ring-hydroxylating ferredoxin subunit